MNNIKRLLNFEKYQLLEDFFHVLFYGSLLLVSFSMGMLYERMRYQEWFQVQIEPRPEILHAWNSYYEDSDIDATYVASRNGTKVYPVSCPSANRIKEENKVFFTTLKQANELGYEESTRC